MAGILSRLSKERLKVFAHIFQAVRHDSSKAGLIVIGDEILKGEVLDTNSHYVTKALHRLGVKVVKICVIEDDVNIIAKEVRKFSDKYNYVLTMGGIGPTHDDVTFQAIANAVDDELVPHPILVKICSEFYKTKDLKNPGMKLAYIPRTAKLMFGEDNQGRKIKYPLISVKNIYIFPGIPALLEKTIDILGPRLFVSDCRFYTATIYVNVMEQFIAGALSELIKEFPTITCGSYPEMFNESYKVKITIESTDEKSTKDATQKLLDKMPAGFVVKWS